MFYDLNAIDSGYKPTQGAGFCVIFFKIYLLDSNQSSQTNNSAGSIPLRLTLGFIAGSVASIANIPFDVAKSRIQGN